MSYIITGEKLREIVFVGTAAINPSAQTLVGDFVVDPTLPQVAVSNYNATGAISVLPGRFLGIGVANTAMSASDASRSTPLTLADGSTFKTIGVAHQAMNKPADNSGGPILRPDAVALKNAQVSTAYIPAYNSTDYGTIASGDKLAAHYGTMQAPNGTAVGAAALRTNVQYGVRGMQVKWIPKKVYNSNIAAGTTNLLVNANNPGVVPTILSFWNAAGTALTSAVTLTWNATGISASLGCWSASAATHTDMMYEVGQDSSHIGGQVIRINPLSNVKNYDQLYKFVRNGRFDGPLSELFQNPRALVTTARTAVSVTPAGTAAAGYSGTVLQSALPVVIDPRSSILVEIQGTVDDNGTSTTYSGGTWFSLPNANTTRNSSIHSGLLGAFHSINWLTGVIKLSSAVTDLTAMRITYSQISSPFVPQFAAGQIGLTDGTIAGEGAGVPAHLNASGVDGELIFWAN